ncbi:uncharacterized protein LOC134287218 [Aedes albopictus]|uniref:Reverse transcriptase domain-containing protein n=1 Tax=Aedes albopictus TaxID=7160 RepID=A0ABM1ZGL3_AEDAL
MAIRSTFFQLSLPYRYTWRSPQQTESQIDHVLIDGRHFSDIIDVRTYRGANIDSDHYLVMVKLRPKLSVINNVHYRRPPRYDLERLKQPDVTTAYAQNLEAALPDEGVLDVAPLEDCWSTVKAAINNAAESTIGYVERSRRNDWFDEECRAVLEEKDAARAVMLQHGTRQNVERYRQKRKQQTRLFREKKRRLEEAECEEKEPLCRSQETRKFYQKLNASRKGYVPQAEICRDKEGSLLTDKREVIERWKQHFDEHLNGEENVGTEDQGSGGNDYVGAAEDGNEPTPTLREVKDAIHQLKNNKAAGKDGIAAELIKMGPEKLATCLHQLVVKIWETEQLPEEWKEGIICPIHKKGDKLMCENFRAITVLNAAYKVLSQIIFRRLSPKVNEFVGSYQAGFIDGRSTTDQIFTSCLLWAPEETAVKKDSPPHQMYHVQDVNKTGGSLRTRDMDDARGGPTSTRSFRATGAKDDLRRCAGERCVAEKNEPRARCTLRRTQHPEGGQSRKDTVGRACCKNAGQQPCKAGVCN